MYQNFNWNNPGVILYLSNNIDFIAVVHKNGFFLCV
jgi:hypothetical protein